MYTGKCFLETQMKPCKMQRNKGSINRKYDNNNDNKKKIK